MGIKIYLIIILVYLVFVNQLVGLVIIITFYNDTVSSFCRIGFYGNSGTISKSNIFLNIVNYVLNKCFCDQNQDIL